MNHIRKPIIALMLFLLQLFSAAAEDEGRLAGQIQLFGASSGPPVVLDSERGWTPVTTVNLDGAGLDIPAAEELRKWRLRTSYEQDHSTGEATIQVRIMSKAAGPVFTHPWTNGSDRKNFTYSNWYENQTGLADRYNAAYVEARLIAPPRTPITGKLYGITLEVWDNKSEKPPVRQAGPDVQLAYVRPLPNAPVKNGTGRERPSADVSPEASLSFALSFVEACITGDLPSYYRLQSNQVISLDDGMTTAKYRQKPPKSISGVADIEVYKRRFDYRIYDTKTLRELFPAWFDSDRPWIPGENSYLFMGHRDRLSSGLSDGIDYLVFLVEPDSEGNWMVVARPGK
jgi:hypothetical protein